tara:strand:- start:2157 stop:2729 length:573 start_codon:yes stop_codon:yes gene_type:complete
MIKKLLNILLILGFAFAQGEIAYKIDTKKSQLLWRAEQLTGNHWGYISIKSGNVIFNSNGQLKTGDIIIDMNTITIEDDTWKEKLKQHLQSDDFFSVKNFPESSFNIKKITPKGSGLEIEGLLTIKGISHPNIFIAEVETNNNGYKATGKVVVDRTLYGIKYRSGKYFPDIGNRLIYDNFTIEFNLKTKR